ncbi:hypothetical protein D9M68_907160 [compost metagenome]
MSHKGVGGRAVPVPFVRPDPHHVALADCLRRFAFDTDPAAARGHVQDLPVLVGVPERTRPRRKKDVVDADVVRRGHDRIGPDHAGECRAALLGRLALVPAMKDLHESSLVQTDFRRTPPDTSPMASTTRLLIWSP